jgi:2-polyprenyl-3-methyl-5-hydroxy-6-metoxy-1,4-benzoquinol methylase
MEQLAYKFIKESEKTHWWFVGRRMVIGKILKTFFKAPLIETLDIGSGYGAMVPLLLTYSKSVDCIEPLQEAEASLKEYGADKVFLISDFPSQYPSKKYNLITMFDVLEHIDNHEKALLIIHDMLLKPEGRILLTVPAYQWMWSKHDEQHHHYRRYSKKDLIHLLRSTGFKNVKASYFMTNLFPLAFFQRLFMKSSLSTKEVQPIHPLLNRFFTFLFSIEAKWVQFFPYPYGLSVLAIAEI